MSTIQSTITLFKRNLTKEFIEPMWVFMGLMEPILYIALYMPLLKNIGVGQSSSEIAKIFVPGILTMMTMGGFFSGFGFIDEMRKGVIDRWLISPISKSSIIFSILLSKYVIGLIQVIILMSIAFFYGLKISLAALAASVMIMNLSAIATISLSHVISIKVKDEGILAGITRTIYLPLMLLSGIMIPMNFAPQWMKIIANFNPFYHLVETCRAFFVDDFTSMTAMKGIGVVMFFAVFSTWLTIRSLKKEVA